jgi:hypothetical protein
MDGYPMLVADGLVNVVVVHKVISFIDDSKCGSYIYQMA